MGNSLYIFKLDKDPYKKYVVKRVTLFHVNNFYIKPYKTGQDDGRLDPGNSDVKSGVKMNAICFRCDRTNLLDNTYKTIKR